MNKLRTARMCPPTVRRSIEAPPRLADLWFDAGPGRSMRANAGAAGCQGDSPMVSRLRISHGFVAVALACVPDGAVAQSRSSDNAVTQAEDAFGFSVGRESLGIYNASYA